ncbi:MAG: ribonuclease R [Prevotellaceae bacterium]|jgi:ribonuclease R|nr:ribonuclease R [Prevotellaceae bacterium]
MARRKYQRIDVLQRLMAYLGNVVKPFTFTQAVKSIRATDGNDKQKVAAAIEVLVAQGRLSRLSDNKYRTREKGVEMIGKLDMTGMGYAFLVSDTSENDVFIPPQALNRALHGDTIRVFVRQTRRRPEGEVMGILERARSEFAGVLRPNPSGSAFVLPDSRHMHQDIYVPADSMNGAKNGDKVVVSIADWPEDSKNPVGKIVDILGRPGENNAEMHAILAEYGLPYRFDSAVEEAAEKVTDDIEKELPNRRDFRGVTTLTIDPKDAKDFDDAISLRKLENGLWEIGVHIADVTHYVKRDSIIDKEAVRRATSVYLVDRTVPMLPERLSNELCSLRPNEEKLCFSAVFEIDENSEVHSQWFGRTVIRSIFRFNYEEVQDIIDCGKGNYAEEIMQLHKLAQQFRAARFKLGSVGFERAEARFDIDKNGKPVGVYFREDTPSHQLVEEFMLLANRSVAERVGKIPQGRKAKTFVYRIHDNPNEQKLANFSHVANQLGHKVNFGKGKTISIELNRLLEEVRGAKEQNLLETLALRCMAKAVYSTKNVGHYGLAFDYYTHFTSPIRRYPDMMVHRLLQRYLEGGSSANAEEYEALCKHSSQREQLAADAERASIKYKMAEYMQDKIGMEYDGVISGVTDRGIYVEINENKIEGMVMLRTLKQDFFYFDEENYRVVGRQSGKTYTLGDPVRIRVDRVNMEKRQLDYLMIEGEYEKEPLEIIESRKTGEAPKGQAKSKSNSRKKSTATRGARKK